MTDGAQLDPNNVKQSLSATGVDACCAGLIDRVLKRFDEDISSAEEDALRYAVELLRAHAALAQGSSPVSDAVVEVGEVGSMPGTSGFTMATFQASDVPVGTKLFARAALKEASSLNKDK